MLYTQIYKHYLQNTLINVSFSIKIHVKEKYIHSFPFDNQFETLMGDASSKIEGLMHRRGGQTTATLRDPYGG